MSGEFSILYKDGFWYTRELKCICMPHTYKCYNGIYNFGNMCKYNGPKYSTFGEAFYVMMKDCSSFSYGHFAGIFSHFDNKNLKCIRFPIDTMNSFSSKECMQTSLCQFKEYSSKMLEYIKENQNTSAFNSLKLNRKKISSIKQLVLNEISKLKYQQYNYNTSSELYKSLYASNSKIIKDIYDSIKAFNGNIKKYNRCKKICKKTNCDCCMKMLFDLDMSYYTIKVKNDYLSDIVSNNEQSYRNIKFMANKINIEITYEDIDFSGINSIKDCNGNDIYRIPTVIEHFINKMHRHDIKLTKEDAFGIGHIIVNKINNIRPRNMEFGSKTDVMIGDNKISIVKYDKTVLPFLMIAVKLIFSDWNTVCKYISGAKHLTSGMSSATSSNTELYDIPSIKDCYNNDIYRVPAVIEHFISKFHNREVKLTKQDAIGVGSIVLNKVTEIIPNNINFGGKTSVVIDGNQLSIVKYDKLVLPHLIAAIKLIFSDWNTVCKYISGAKEISPA